MTLIKSLIFIGLILTLPGAGGQETGTLKLTVTNIRHAEGSIRIALYNSEDKFLEEECLDKSSKVTHTGDIEIEIPGLAPGKYGISIFHDVNDNGELDKNFVGIPKEPFGFGNNSMGAFGPPGFDKASVEVKASSSTETSIKLKSF